MHSLFPFLRLSRYAPPRFSDRGRPRTLITSALIAASLCSCSKGPSERMSVDDTQALADAKASAETAIRNTLENPASAQFQNEQIFMVTGHPGSVVCGDFADKDRSGGMTGYSDFVWGTADSLSPGLKTLAGIGVDEFSGLQMKACTDTPGVADQAETQIQNQV